MKQTFTLAVLFIFGQLAGISQSTEINENEDLTTIIPKMMAEFKKKEHVKPIHLSNDHIKRENPERIIALLEPYRASESFVVQETTYYYLVKTAELHPSTQIRTQITEKLVRCMLDINSPSNGSCGNWLLEFQAGDFDSNSGTLLKKALEKEPSRKKILISGVASMKEVLPQLKNMLIDEIAYGKDPNNRFVPWQDTLAWDARLARARMGVAEDVNRCVLLIEREIIKDQFQLDLLSDLGYIRQVESVELLKKLFMSDYKLPSVDGMKPEAYSSYLLPILDDNLVNFPFKIDKDWRAYSNEQIDLVKKWLQEQKEWQIRR